MFKSICNFLLFLIAAERNNFRIRCTNEKQQCVDHLYSLRQNIKAEELHKNELSNFIDKIIFANSNSHVNNLLSYYCSTMERIESYEKMINQTWSRIINYDLMMEDL